MGSKFTYYKQLNSNDCGPTCLRMVAKYYGRYYSAEALRAMMSTSKDGASLLSLSRASEKLGFRSRGCQISAKILEEIPLPAILHWNQNHFVVLQSTDDEYTVADPAVGSISYDKDEFLSQWISNVNESGERVGTVLILEPSPLFYEEPGEKPKNLNWSIYLQYFAQNISQINRIFMALGISFLIQLIFPFLAQSMVDNGINAKNLNFITLILIAQLVLTLTSTIIGFISNRIQIRITNIINISILSDFWIKLTRLPLSFFDNHRAGDIIQRLGDNKTVQSFITNFAMNTIYSVVNFCVYSIILISYNGTLFLIFIVGNTLYVVWVRLFLPFRRKLNYQGFNLSTAENNSTIQLVYGMQELRLNNAEQSKRWEWEDIQARIFKLSIKNLNYNQWQSAGALFINQGKDIVITYMVARLVVEGNMTFGGMIAIQYIIGQLGGPISNLVGLIQSYQDASISLERLNEIHSAADEEPKDVLFQNDLSDKKGIEIKNLHFTYPGQDTAVLKNINMVIAEQKTTAIVGMSGSGKTTLLKILMKILPDYKGEINVGERNFKMISPFYWRSLFGSVMQEGYIFDDTIAKNISLSDEVINHQQLIQATKMANIYSFIDGLPNGWNTVVGALGVGLSQGQRQRLLIARALYKKPEFLFFDEATNALDANNEKEIIENLYSFFVNKTVIVVAHRLSTVKNADQIFVMKNGEIAEQGNHNSLVALKGEYFELVRNQLELGG